MCFTRWPSEKIDFFAPSVTTVAFSGTGWKGRNDSILEKNIGCQKWTLRNELFILKIEIFFRKWVYGLKKFSRFPRSIFYIGKIFLPPNNPIFVTAKLTNFGLYMAFFTHLLNFWLNIWAWNQVILGCFDFFFHVGQVGSPSRHSKYHNRWWKGSKMALDFQKILPFTAYLLYIYDILAHFCTILLASNAP